MTIDTTILLALNSLAEKAPSLVLFLADYLAYVTIALFIIVVFISAYPRRAKLELLVVSFAAGVVARFGAVELIRYFYHRPRPFLALPDQIHSLFTDPSWSFPSGHASFFFAISTAVFLYNRRWGSFLFVLSAVISIARVAAGVHYPSDILGGAFLGALVGYATVKVARSFAQKDVNPTY